MTAATFAWATALIAGAAGAVAAHLRRRRGNGPLTMASVLVGAMTLALVAFIGLVVGRSLVPLDLFGLLHVAYLAAVVAGPFGAALLALLSVSSLSRPTSARSATVPVLITAVVAAVVGASGAYSSYVAPNRLQVDDYGTVSVPGRAGTDPIRMAVLTDLQTAHVGDHEERAVDALVESRPDVVLIPGDVFQGDGDEFERELPALRRLIGRIQAPGGVFLVEGDVDGVARLRRIIEGSTVQLLDNEIVLTRVGDRTLTIGGMSLHTAEAERVALRDELERRVGDDDIRILLTHRPDPVLDLPAPARTDLVVAGHTHGGQIAIPLLGPLVTMSDVPRAVAAGGLHDLDGRRILVGRGVGMERGQAPAIRFLVPPNIPVFTLG